MPNAAWAAGPQSKPPVFNAEAPDTTLRDLYISNLGGLYYLPPGYFLNLP
jgi:hypothetical protein